MEKVCKYIRLHNYTILKKYHYFLQDDNDIEHYIGGNISITSHIIKNIQSLSDIIKVIDINDECGIVIFHYINNQKRGSICEIKSNGLHYWLINIFNL